MSGSEDGKLSSGRRSGQGDQLEAVDYISSNLMLLAKMARHHHLGNLAYMIDIAKMEAEEALKVLRRR